jgi:antitoxin (DNA-binding transcriptional repressor) of toxin-antitoxin stability system
MKHQVVSVTEFKAKCLALLDDIGQHGGKITITKRGRPLAIVGPPRRPRWKSPEGVLEGKVFVPDEVWDTDTSSLWEAVTDPDAVLNPERRP